MIDKIWITSKEIGELISEDGSINSLELRKLIISKLKEELKR